MLSIKRAQIKPLQTKCSDNFSRFERMDDKKYAFLPICKNSENKFTHKPYKKITAKLHKNIT